MMLQKTTIDPTQQSLEAAILDQKIAGQMGDQPYAYVAVYTEGTKFGLGIAVEDQQGYSPITGIDFDSHDQAHNFADGMNRHIGLDGTRAAQIICSSMRR